MPFFGSDWRESSPEHLVEARRKVLDEVADILLELAREVESIKDPHERTAAKLVLSLARVRVLNLGLEGGK